MINMYNVVMKYINVLITWYIDISPDIASNNTVPVLVDITIDLTLIGILIIENYSIKFGLYYEIF